VRYISRYRVGVSDVAELVGGARPEDSDQGAVCGAHILEPQEGVRFLAGELPTSAVDPAVPLTAHQQCLRRPTTYFLSHRHEIEARVAAEAVVWRWMTGPRDDGGPAGGDGAGVST
jgi:hypothetical protein